LRAGASRPSYDARGVRMAAAEIPRAVLMVVLACSACNAGPESSVAIGVLNLEDEPRRLVKVCLERRCTEVNTVLEHGDEAILTVKPRDPARADLTVEVRGGQQLVLPCEVRLHSGLIGSLQVALSHGKVRVLENKLHPVVSLKPASAPVDSQ
jgi:hypothetical protein